MQKKKEKKKHNLLQSVSYSPIIISWDNQVMFFPRFSTKGEKEGEILALFSLTFT